MLFFGAALDELGLPRLGGVVLPAAASDGVGLFEELLGAAASDVRRDFRAISVCPGGFAGYFSLQMVLQFHNDAGTDC
jgi:hypothetical protein